jgi:hypothetical protein
MEVFRILDFGSGVDVDGLIAEFNAIQPFIELSRCDLVIAESADATVDPDDFFASVGEARGDNTLRVIGITALPLKNNYFSHTNRTYDIAIISTDQSELYTPKFSVEDYLKEEILSSVFADACTHERWALRYSGLPL